MSKGKDKTAYAAQYRDIDFRKHPELYPVGAGEQGVLIAEPYKSELLPHWRFKTEQLAKDSSRKIFEMFEQYKRDEDFVGMDMARKFLQMGFTRARRYANHPSGRKYDDNRKVLPQANDALTSEKARAAAIFYEKYLKAKDDPEYIRLKELHMIKVHTS